MADISKKQKEQAEEWFGAIVAHVQETGKPVSDFMEITPARASVLLQHNPNNRHIRPVKLDQLTRDMENGRYQVNGESIIVSKEGVLNDGQHRLTAIVKTGISQLVNMAFGVSRESRTTVDSGAARTAGDHLGLAGLTNSNVTAAVARKIMSYKNAGTFSATNRISGAEVLEYINRDNAIHEFACWASNHHHKLKAIKLSASEAGAIFYLIAEKAPKEAKQFMEGLAEGLYLTPSSPIHIVRQSLTIKQKLNPNNRLELVIRAWNNWIKDTEVTVIPMRGRIPEIVAGSTK